MSGAASGSEETDLSGVNQGAETGDGGIPHGQRLLAFTDAVMRGSDEDVERERAALRAVLTDAEYVDAVATIGAFNVVDRIADSTGIPLDDGLRAMSEGVRSELNLARFGSAANTLGRDPV